MARFFDLSQKAEAEELPAVPLGGTRAQAVQRLQIGIAGVLLMMLMVGLASIIQNRAADSDAKAVPAAASTTEPIEKSVQVDPLAEAGVVPDLPTGPAEAPAPNGQAPAQSAGPASPPAANGGQ